MELRESPDPSTPFLDTVEGEISFFRSIMRARPVGLHRHFHVLSMRTAIHQDTGRYVTIDDIWEKLRSCYNIDALESLDAEGFESPGSTHSTPSIVDSPSPSDNLSLHPYFRKEFALPYDEALDSIVSSRRVRDSASSTSSSPSPPPPPIKGRRGRRRGRGSARPTAQINAESDSSALTLESGDESVAPTPKESVNTGTDPGTDYGDDEDVEVAASPALSAKPGRGRGRGGRARGTRGRGRGAESARGIRKRKRGA
ncbi:chromatin modification-related protein EAF7-domain-containing protein [Multifurca ochricompacta]|uniref:Chromatin modification-related protein EAF7-domain-containing protein n=1 Tax=Multifurca ochricompacta TaxID=376703 RepID=A0AAD4M848_9AGAM|nr:chromatin modification-related protein EAF7-domain-containing protein [Multifurca ochricompacta]